MAQSAHGVLRSFGKQPTNYDLTFDNAIQFLLSDLKKVHDSDLRIMYMTNVINDVDLHNFE
jgi:hypothetical protein